MADLKKNKTADNLRQTVVGRGEFNYDAVLYLLKLALYLRTETDSPIRTGFLACSTDNSG